MRRIATVVWILSIWPLSTPAEEAPAPRHPTPRVLGSESLLSLQEAEVLALENNRGLVVARTVPQLAETFERQAEGVFDPLAFAEYGFEHEENPVVSPFQTGFTAITFQRIDNDAWRGGTGLSGLLPFGLSYSSSYTYTRLDSGSTAITALERDYRPVWESQATLPLLRDFIHNEANVTLKRSRIQHSLSEEEFRESLIELVAGVANSYWALAALRATENVAAKSLEVANDLVEQTRVQYEVGVVSRVNVSQAAAGQAEREFDFIVAQAAAGNAQDALIDLIEHPDLAALRTTRLVTEEPAFVEYSVDEEVAVGKAMRLRPELAQRRRRVEESELDVAFARNQRLPRLDLSGGYTLTGLAGPGKELVDPNGTVLFPGGKIDDVPQRGRSANNNFFSARGAHSWRIGGRVEIPIGNRTARARVTQRRIELRRARTALRQQEQEVVLEVRKAARDLRAAIQGLEAAERRRAAQSESLRAEQEKLRLGDSTPREVLEQQRDLTEAERQVIAALQVYRDSITALERSQGTLLPALGIRFEDELNR
jgi:outer membrane protein TolC